MFARFESPLRHALNALVADGSLPAPPPQEALLLEAPKDPDHGDIALNAALVLAKSAKCAPRPLAEKIAAQIEKLALPEIAKITIAGPGFINLTLTADFFRAELPRILAAGEAYGAPDLGQGEKVSVEYVSANPTGPLHIGHARGAVLGDALANLLAHAGYQVAREFYVNDAGAQIDALTQSLKLRIAEQQGESITMPENAYSGDYLIPLAKRLADNPAQQENLRQEALDAMMNIVREDLAALNIHHDNFIYESELLAAGKIDAAIKRLEEENLLYTGTLEKPKSGAIEDWSPRPQLLFRASQFGDTQDRPLKRADDGWTYFAGDIACHWDKVERGFGFMINVWGADHGGYVPRLKAAINALSKNEARLEVLLCHLIRLMEGGKAAKMSKRKGNLVALKTLIDATGADAVRFLLLTRRHDAPLDFDLIRAREQSKDNPVFYVQYAHARICSVLRQAPPDILAAEKSGTIALEPLAHEAELALMRQLAHYPRLLQRATSQLEPHRLAFYLQNLAASFHALWNLGRDQPELRFLIPEQRNATLARLQLIRSCRIVLASGLRLLGVSPVEEM